MTGESLGLLMLGDPAMLLVGAAFANLGVREAFGVSWRRERALAETEVARRRQLEAEAVRQIEFERMLYALTHGEEGEGAAGVEGEEEGGEAEDGGEEEAGEEEEPVGAHDFLLEDGSQAARTTCRRRVVHNAAASSDHFSSLDTLPPIVE